jgi:hypothetical protein
VDKIAIPDVAENLPIVSDKSGSRYLMIPSNSRYVPVIEDKPAYISPWFRLYPLTDETLDTVYWMAKKRNKRIEHNTVYWADLNEREWRIANRVRKQLA